MEAVFNISLPTSWAELTDKQLHMTYNLFARDLSAAEVKTLCLMKWNGLKVLSPLPDKRFLIKRGKEVVPLSTRQIQQATSVLDFLDSFAPMPVRIARIDKYHALPQSDELLQQMAQVLYGRDHIKPSKAHLVGIFYWMASLKQYFARLFPNFYKPASDNSNGNLLGNGQSDIYSQLRDSTNAMIRALTGGDISKEDAIMKMDTWRALTELDAKAREVEELRKVTKKP